MTENQIESLLQELERIEQFYPEVGPLALSARNAIAMSRHRACATDGKTVGAASHTIAAACAIVLQAVLKNHSSGRYVSSILLRFLSTLTDLAQNARPRHVPLDEAEAPEGFEGARGGPFKARFMESHELTLVHRPNTPWGTWFLHLDGLDVYPLDNLTEAPVAINKLRRLYHQGTSKPSLSRLRASSGHLPA